jgi:ELWxxDGT repeat protein
VEVWSSDGTPAGTVLLRDFGMTTVGFRDFRVGDALFFVLSDESRGTELWKTDGTSDGTVRVRRLDLGILYVSDAIAAGPAGFFTLEEFDGSTELWRTDGTTGGTVRLDAFGPAYLSPRFLGTLGRFLYFTVTDASAQRLVLYRRRVDGTGDRVRIVTLPNPYADEGSAFPYVELASQASGKIFFTLAIGSSGPAPRDTQLWVTNGTRSGTKLLRRPLSLSDEYSSPLLATGGLAFFAAYSPSVGIEPWVSDGTVSGTRRLKNVAPGSESSTPRSYTRVGRRVFFSAYDDTLAGQLWSVPLLHSCSFSGVEPALEETAAPRRE